MATRAKHTHKYMRQQLSPFNTGWRCVLDYCTHFLPRNVEDTITGRMSLCWGCGNEFKLDEDAIKSDQPMCFNCRTPQSERDELEELGRMIELKQQLAKFGVDDVSELDENKRRLLKSLGLLD